MPWPFPEYDGAQPELVRIEVWRLAQLLGAGYPNRLAERLAASHEVDLHEAVDLVRGRGCAPELAARILL